MIKLYRCKRCGWDWPTRKPQKPMTCPKCRSPYWNKKRRSEQSEEEETIKHTVEKEPEPTVIKHPGMFTKKKEEK